MEWSRGSPSLCDIRQDSGKNKQERGELGELSWKFGWIRDQSNTFVLLN